MIHNPNAASISINLPAKGDWGVVVKGSVAGTKVLATLKGANKVNVDASSTLVLEK